MTQPFELSSQFYDLLYQEKNSIDEVEYIHQILQRYRPETTNILEFGSGTGRHGCLLAAKGYLVHGIELSPEMVAASRHATGFSCQEGDIIETKLTERFDALLAIFHVVSYQTTNGGIQALFANASEHLRPGGVFLFDIWYSAAVLTQSPEVRIKRLKTTEMNLTRIAEPTVFSNENRIDVHYTIFAHRMKTGVTQTFEETHPMRHFSLPELDLFAEASGFERLTAEEWLTGAPPSEATWGVCVVLRKR